jgi:hypothetical protein
MSYLSETDFRDTWYQETTIKAVGNLISVPTGSKQLLLYMKLKLNFIDVLKNFASRKDKKGGGAST